MSTSSVSCWIYGLARCGGYQLWTESSCSGGGEGVDVITANPFQTGCWSQDDSSNYAGLCGYSNIFWKLTVFRQSTGHLSKQWRAVQNCLQDWFSGSNFIHLSSRADPWSSFLCCAMLSLAPAAWSLLKGALRCVEGAAPCRRSCSRARACAGQACVPEAGRCLDQNLGPADPSGM